MSPNTLKNIDGILITQVLESERVIYLNSIKKQIAIASIIVLILRFAFAELWANPLTVIFIFMFIGIYTSTLLWQVLSKRNLIFARRKLSQPSVARLRNESTSLFSKIDDKTLVSDLMRLENYLGSQK